MLTTVLAFFIDCILGDPRSRFHPVVLIGNLVAWLDHCFYRPEDTNEKKLLAGGVLVLIVLVVCYEAAWCVLRLIELIPLEHLGMALEALLLAFMISPKSLAVAGMEIRNLLKDGELSEARRKVGWIVGRDTEKLSAPEASRAAIETVAENTVDGIISPLFFYLVGGLPLAVLYRAANTMDSMLGYKNAKYLYFGRVAARLDDVLNYIPARVTGALFVLAAFLLHFDGRRAWRILRRDAAKHPSPNGGHAEAPVAGALGIRLGGKNYYFGEPHFRAYMGEARREIEADDIQKTVRLMYTVTILFLLFAYGGFLLWQQRGMLF